MVTPVLTPPAPAESDASARRRRWPRIVGSVGMLLAVAMIAGVIWVIHYQPFVSSEAGMVAPGGRVTSTGNVFGTEYTLHRPRPGTVVTIYADLAIAGPVPVTVVSVGNPFPDGHGGMINIADHWVVQMRPTPQSEQFIPFHPVALNGESWLRLRLQFTIPDCAPRNDGSTVATSFPVTYRVLGITRTVEVPAADTTAYSLAHPPACGLPLP